jgi:SAM-dependent methyltransferase
VKFETRYTYDFIRRFLPSNCRRILEIGCGKGELAVRLSKDGYHVVAIDLDPDSIAAAQRLGVNAHVAKWPDFADGQFDAILFTRSLHHIHPLAQSVRRAADSLTDGGRIIVEDFAYESTDEKTLCWFASAIRLLRAANILAEGDEFLNEMLAKTETLNTWRQVYENELHTAGEIHAQLENITDPVLRENSAYYFRYIAHAIDATEESDAIVQTFAEQEETLIADGSIVALGRRFVAGR